MKKRVLYLPILLLVIFLVGCQQVEDPADSPIVSMMRSSYGINQEIIGDYDKTLSVKTKTGTFLGKEEDGIRSYKGIPYAKPPVNELRWKEPQPLEDSQSVYEAYYFGKSPIQSEWPSEVGSYYEKGEDALTLNVWTNTANKKSNKPVLVFLHGGSYGWGATSDPMYNGHNLIAKFDDVILVTVEYRLGMMGFIDFSMVEGGEEYATSGNLGLLDQVAALKWLKENIQSFGGDANNITVMGESAGAGSVSLLPLIEGTEGLFQRVIAQSGSVALTTGRENSQEQTRLLLEKSQSQNMADLLALSEEELLGISEEISDQNIFPLRDGVVLPENLYEAYELGQSSHIDMMIGSNADEARYWLNEMGYYSDWVSGKTIYSLGMQIMLDNDKQTMSFEDQQLVDQFISQLEDKKIWNITEFYNEMLFRLPAIKQTDAHVHNGGTAFMYYWKEPSADSEIGAMHAVELAYLFNNLDNTTYTGDTADKNYADQVQQMWINFVRTGNPSTDIEWPKYNANNRATMILESDNIYVKENLKGDQREMLTPLLNYNLSGSYSQMSFMVPTVFRYVAIVILIILIIIGCLILIKKKQKT